MGRSTRGLQHVLVLSKISQHLALAFLQNKRIFAHTLAVFPSDSYALFAVLQSRTHEAWVRFFGSSLEDRMRYTTSDCFETFPMPEAYESSAMLERIGREYYEFRAALMAGSNEGLTKIYNRFHDPAEYSPDIERLRDLHTALDLTLFDAYGWANVEPKSEFLPQYEEGDNEDSARKKPLRYRWPNEIHDEVLARLLKLNERRAKEERLSGGAADGKATSKSSVRRTRRVVAAQSSFQTAKSEK